MFKYFFFIENFLGIAIVFVILCQLNLLRTAGQVDIPTNPNLLITSSAIRDAMEKVMPPIPSTYETLQVSRSSCSCCREDKILVATPTSECLSGIMTHSSSPDFQGSEHHRRIAPNTSKECATEAA